MSDSKNPLGCTGLLVIAMFLVTASFIVYRVTSEEIRESDKKLSQQEQDQERLIKHLEATGEPIGPEFTTMDDQLSQAKEAGSKITEFRMEGIPEAIKGPWVVKDVGYDVVVLEGPAGLMTIRMESIVGILVGHKEPKKIPEPLVEQ